VAIHSDQSGRYDAAPIGGPRLGRVQFDHVAHEAGRAGLAAQAQQNAAPAIVHPDGFAGQDGIGRAQIVGAQDLSGRYGAHGQQGSLPLELAKPGRGQRRCPEPGGFLPDDLQGARIDRLVAAERLAGDDDRVVSGHVEQGPARLAPCAARVRCPDLDLQGARGIVDGRRQTQLNPIGFGGLIAHQARLQMADQCRKRIGQQRIDRVPEPHVHRLGGRSQTEHLQQPDDPQQPHHQRFIWLAV